MKPRPSVASASKLETHTYSGRSAKDVGNVRLMGATFLVLNCQSERRKAARVGNYLKSEPASVNW